MVYSSYEESAVMFIVSNMKLEVRWVFESVSQSDIPSLNQLVGHKIIKPVSLNKA